MCVGLNFRAPFQEFDIQGINPEPTTGLPFLIINRLIALVHDHVDQATILILEGGTEQMTAAAHRANSLGTRMDELREVANVVVSRRVDQLTVLGITVDGCEAEITYVIGATALVEQNVPICPTDSAIVKVIDLHKVGWTPGDGVQHQGATGRLYCFFDERDLELLIM